MNRGGRSTEIVSVYGSESTEMLPVTTIVLLPRSRRMSMVEVESGREVVAATFSETYDVAGTMSIETDRPGVFAGVTVTVIAFS